MAFPYALFGDGLDMSDSDSSTVAGDAVNINGLSICWRGVVYGRLPVFCHEENPMDAFDLASVRIGGERDALFFALFFNLTEHREDRQSAV